MDAATEVLDKLEAAVEDGLRRSTTRGEHIRWQTVRTLLDRLQVPDGRNDGR